MRSVANPIIAATIVLVIAGGALGASEAVRVQVKETVVERKVFDPRNPPADLPRLGVGEEAVTTAHFDVMTEMRGEVVSERRSEGQVSSTLRISSVTVTTGLKVVIWLPDNAPPSLKAHEEGHRRIAEMYYKEADPVAKKLATEALGKVYTGEGEDGRRARRAAIVQASQELNRAYLKSTQEVAKRVDETFDRITDHGRNRRISVDRGIELAVERVRTEMAEKSNP